MCRNSTYSISYSYDVNGLRTEKAVTQNGVTTNYQYFYSGSTLLQERIGNNTILNFIYTADGKPYALEYSTDAGSSYTTYYYLTNLQGDVISILNSNGTAVVSYSYDSWGQITATTGSLATTLGTDNPLRYRGYVFDEELSYYYLQSRYYDPDAGRFISADDTSTLSVTPYELTDKNLFAYCDNNPVMREDKGGQLWNFVIGGAVGAVIGGVIAAVTSYKETGTVNVWKVAIGVVGGAASGVVAASGLGWIAQAGITAGISGLSDFGNQTIDIVDNGGSVADYDVLRTVKETALGGLTSAVGSGLGALTGKYVTGTSKLANQAFDNYLEKTFSAGLRKGAGRSASALLRKAGRYLGESVFYDNVTKGVSSCIGSVLSLWNCAR